MTGTGRAAWLATVARALDASPEVEAEVLAELSAHLDDAVETARIDAFTRVVWSNEPVRTQGLSIIIAGSGATSVGQVVGLLAEHELSGPVAVGASRTSNPNAAPTVSGLLLSDATGSTTRARIVSSLPEAFTV